MLYTDSELGVQGFVVAQTVDVSKLADGLRNKLYHALLSARRIESHGLQRRHGCGRGAEHDSGREKAVEETHPARRRGG